ncbi:MAG: GNAT family N-acetyltransferase [Anaerolineae bacterium]|nr:GNAT family N-acetyltransferase [Anaerolineae bacterium]
MSEIVTIRARRADDWAGVYEIYSHEHVARRSLRVLYPSPDAVREAVAKVDETLHALVAVIAQPDRSERVAGLLDLQTSKWHRRKHVASLHLAVHPDYQDVAGEALMAAALDLADSWLGLRRVELDVFTDDAPAIALYEKCGFTREVTVRRYAIRDGDFADAFVMARINERLGGRRKAEGSPTGFLGSPRAKERPQVVVRGQRLSDVEALYEMYNTSSAYAGTMGVPYRSLDDIRRMMEHPHEGFYPLVAEVDGRVVGSSGISFMFGRRKYVAGVGMIVHPDYQGVGVGTALMRAAVDMTQNWSEIRRLELEVYPDNLHAIALYEKFGFEHEGCLRDYGFQNGFYIDALKMARLFD